MRALAERRLINLSPAGYWHQGHPYRWLERLPPALRGEVFTLLRGDRPAGVVDVQLLTLLPPELRRQQARRCLDLPRLATLPEFVCMYLPFCLLANFLSIFAPMPIRAGSFKPVNPRGLPILLHLPPMAGHGCGVRTKFPSSLYGWKSLWISRARRPARPKRADCGRMTATRR